MSATGAETGQNLQQPQTFLLLTAENCGGKFPLNCRAWENFWALDFDLQNAETPPQRSRAPSALKAATAFQGGLPCYWVS